MAKPFPDHPNLRGGYAPIQMECAAPNLVIEGEIPSELEGSLYRIGPNPQFAPRVVAVEAKVWRKIFSHTYEQ